MDSIAARFGQKVLRDVDPEEFFAKGWSLSERPVRRAKHFFEENERVPQMRDALRNGNGEEYMIQLSNRLEAIEAAKHYYETERRRNRSHMVVAFVSGSITGVVLTVYLLMHPLFVSVSPQVPHFLEWLVDNISLLLTASTIVVLSVLFAIAATLFHSLWKKDYSL